MSETAFRRLRRAEFLGGLPTSFPGLFLLPDGTRARDGVALLVLLAVGIAAALHGRCLQWPHLTLTAGLVWLLWGAAGLLLMGAPLVAGWAWTYPLASIRRQRPLLHLLPLTERQVVAAKLQGRLAGALVSLAAGFVLDVIARGLMIATATVVVPPPLLDPWLIGGMILFFGAFALSWRVDWCVRRNDYSKLTFALTSGWVALIVVCSGSERYARHNQWDAALLPVAFALSAFSVNVIGAVLVLVVRAVRRRRRAAAPARPAAPRRGALGGLSPLRMQSGQPVLSRGVPASVARLTLVTTLAVLFAQGCSLLWYGWLGYRAAGRFSLVSPDLRLALASLAVLPLLAVAATVIYLPMAAWAEQFGTAAVMRSATRQPLLLNAPHLGYLLPVPSRRLWLMRLHWLLMVDGLLVCGGLLSYLLVQVLNWALGLGGRPVLPATVLAAALVIPALSWAVFGCVPPLRRTVALLATMRGRSLLWLPVALLAVAALAGGAATSATAGVSLVPVSLAVTALLLWLSWTIQGEQAWPLDPDGSASDRSKAQAICCLLALPIVAAVLLSGLIAVIQSTVGA